jgi:hypothetical protein
MKVVNHNINNTRIAEVISDEMLVETIEDGLSLMGDMYYQEFGCVILHERNFTPLFFDLKNGIAGEILQKFSTYRMRLAIVGDFSKYTSKSLKDFIYESNKGKQVCFVGSVSEALKLFS